MHERRHDSSPDAKPAHHHDAAGAGPGKTTRVEQLGQGGVSAHAAGKHDDDADPKASAARKKKKGLLETFHHELKKAADKVAHKVADKLTGAPERALEKLLKKLEDAANDEIADNLRPNDKSCLNQQAINDVEAAINTTRLIATFHMIHKIDKAVLAEIDTLHSDKSIVEKGLALLHNIEDALSALNTYGDAMDLANSRYNRLLKQAARCRPVARINPELHPITVPKQFKKLPETIHLPPDIEHPGPTIHIGVPGLLIG